MKNLIFLCKFLLPIFREKKFIWYFLLSFMALIVGILADIYSPLIFKHLIDKLYNQNFILIGYFIAGYSLLWTISQSNIHIKEFFSNKIELSITTFLISHGVNHILYLPFARYYNKSSADMFNIIQRAQNAIPFVFMQLFFYIIPVIIEIICISLILTKYYNLTYGMILISILVLFLIYNFYFQKKLDILSHKLVEASDVTNSKILDFLMNYETIKSYGLELKSSHLIKQQLNIRKDIFVHVRSQYALIRFGQVIILGLGVLIITMIIINDIRQGLVASGSFVLLIGYLIQLVSPINIIGYTLKDFKKSLIELKDIIEFLKTKDIHNKGISNFAFDEINIAFKNIYFTYKKHKVLKNFSLQIPYGKKIILAGSSGIGKSSIAKLIVGLYSADKGEITLNNIDYESISPVSLGKLFTYIPQETQLLNASLKENLLFTTINENITDKDLDAAIKFSKLETFVENRLHNNINTNIGDRGVQISGGEKQRIGIARLFLRVDSKVIILDEPFASLDEQVAAEIYFNIVKIFKSKTIIIITHKILSSMLNEFEVVQL